MNINLKNLTKEQIADLRNQLAELDKPKESHFTDIKSWEDAFKIVKPKWSMDTDGIIREEISVLYDSDYYKGYIPSESHAKSILASCKLMVIAEALNEGWKPDWNDSSQLKNRIVYNHLNKSLQVESDIYFNGTNIYIKDYEIAKYCAEQFKDLWYDYFMVEQHEK